MKKIITLNLILIGLMVLFNACGGTYTCELTNLKVSYHQSDSIHIGVDYGQFETLVYDSVQNRYDVEDSKFVLLVDHKFQCESKNSSFIPQVDMNRAYATQPQFNYDQIEKIEIYSDQAFQGKPAGANISSYFGLIAADLQMKVSDLNEFYTGSDMTFIYYLNKEISISGVHKLTFKYFMDNQSYTTQFTTEDIQFN
jgi:hypothetical protein